MDISPSTDISLDTSLKDKICKLAQKSQIQAAIASEVFSPLPSPALSRETSPSASEPQHPCQASAIYVHPVPSTPSVSYRPSRDTTFDIDQLGRITPLKSDAKSNISPYRYHSARLPQPIDFAIVSPKNEESVSLPPILADLENTILPSIRALFPEYRSKWQIK